MRRVNYRLKGLAVLERRPVFTLSVFIPNPVSIEARAKEKKKVTTILKNQVFHLVYSDGLVFSKIIAKKLSLPHQPWASNRANLLKLNGHFALLWLSKFDFQISLRIVSSLS